MKILRCRSAKTLFDYDSTNRLQRLSHLEVEQESIFDRVQYEYDLLGNKVKVIKERQNILEDTGVFEYVYDPLNRLQEVIKGGESLREYTYDGYGNRTRLVDSSNGRNHTTNYTYNALNQLISTEDSGNNRQEFHYDNRGNLIETYEGKNLTHKYHFGALNRMEKAFNHQTGQGATYGYNGLSQRVGRTEGRPTAPVLPTESLDAVGLDPIKQVEDVLDLTKKYHNLLQRKDNQEVTSFTWDQNIISSHSSDGSYNHYLLDELGSPIRTLDEHGNGQDIFGFDEFGNRLVDSNIEINMNQPFTYTGYQRDEVAGTYYAQAREYLPQVGRFTGEDIVRGFAGSPQTINPYLYCLNSPSNYVDLDGRIPSVPTLDYGCSGVTPTPLYCEVNQKVEELNRIANALDDDLDFILRERIDRYNTCPDRVFSEGAGFLGQTVTMIPVGSGAASYRYTIIYLGGRENADLLRHESAHFHGQYLPLGTDTFMRYIALPSLISSDGPWFWRQYFSIRYGNDFVTEMLEIFDGLPHVQMPWEVYADIVAGVRLGDPESDRHDILCRSRALWYHEILLMKSPEHPGIEENPELIDLILREFRGVDVDACP